MRKYFPIRIGGSVIIPRMVSIAALWMLLFALIACQPVFESGPVGKIGSELSEQEERQLREAKRTRDRQLSRAENGDVDAQVRLGRTYCCGSPDVNLAKATFWLCQAASNQSPEALYSLAEIYAGHKQVENYSLALAYAELAREFGHPNGLNAKVRLMKQLSQSGISEGMALAESFPDIPCRIADVAPAARSSSKRSPSPVSMPANIPKDGFASTYRSGAMMISPANEDASGEKMPPASQRQGAAGNEGLTTDEEQAQKDDEHFRTYSVQESRPRMLFPDVIPEAGGTVNDFVTRVEADASSDGDSVQTAPRSLPLPPPPPVDTE